jgi:hypothetical protein
MTSVIGQIHVCEWPVINRRTRKKLGLGHGSIVRCSECGCERVLAEISTEYGVMWQWYGRKRFEDRFVCKGSTSQ